ncbi:hypothetical protein EYF80_028078 [Liparis tanakae]|uniref:Uncharacterized protein n=1 Tax=Liparis tanakae TaxID=230148 RepID=A0A4Z2H7G8_9TELE|nr:hypothetical protein EYF80_028078 [Liparis tanakae]
MTDSRMTLKIQVSESCRLQLLLHFFANAAFQPHRVDYLLLVSEISGGTLERSAMQHVLFGRVIALLLTLVHPRQRCALIKDSFKFKADGMPLEWGVPEMRISILNA